MKLADIKGLWHLLSAGSVMLKWMVIIGFASLLLASLLPTPIPVTVGMSILGSIMLCLSGMVLLVTTGHLCNSPSFLMRPKLRYKAFLFLLGYAVSTSLLLSLATAPIDLNILKFQPTIWAFFMLALFVALCAKSTEAIIIVLAIFCFRLVYWILTLAFGKPNWLTELLLFIEQYHVVFLTSIIVASSIGIAYSLSSRTHYRQGHLNHATNRISNSIARTFVWVTPNSISLNSTQYMLLLNHVTGWASASLQWLIPLCMIFAINIISNEQARYSKLAILSIMLAIPLFLHLQDHSIHTLKRVWLRNTHSRADLFKIWENVQREQFIKIITVAALLWAVISVIYSFTIPFIIFGFMLVVSISALQVYLTAWFSSRGQGYIVNAFSSMALHAVNIAFIYLIYAQALDALLPAWTLLSALEIVIFRVLLKSKLKTIDWMKIPSPPKLPSLTR